MEESTVKTLKLVFMHTQSLLFLYERPLWLAVCTRPFSVVDAMPERILNACIHLLEVESRAETEIWGERNARRHCEAPV